MIAVYKVAEQKNLLSRRPSIEERAFDMFLAIAILLFILLPFFIDNIRLGQEFQIEGRGILSRPVAHSLMVKNDIARTGLGTVERVIFWLNSIPSLFTAPLLITAGAGVFMALKNRVTLAKPLILYLVLTIGYIMPFTHIEYRFLAPAVPAAAAFTGYAVAQVARKSKLLGAVIAAVVLVYAFPETSFYGLVPTFQQPAVITGWQIFLSYSRYAETWFSDYVAYLDGVLRPPNLLLPISYVAAAWSTILFLAAAVYIGFKNPL
uniref:Uncharacterized protein n=1 Tax=Caldiarchaeum subterraneum TaxID=311458 RepID=A0A7C5U6Z6_CALS0